MFFAIRCCSRSFFDKISHRDAQNMRLCGTRDGHYSALMWLSPIQPMTAVCAYYFANMGEGDDTCNTHAGR